MHATYYKSIFKVYNICHASLWAWLSPAYRQGRLQRLQSLLQAYKFTKPMSHASLLILILSSKSTIYAMQVYEPGYRLPIDRGGYKGYKVYKQISLPNLWAIQVYWRLCARATGRAYFRRVQTNHEGRFRGGRTKSMSPGISHTSLFYEACLHIDKGGYKGYKVYKQTLPNLWAIRFCWRLCVRRVQTNHEGRFHTELF